MTEKEMFEELGKILRYINGPNDLLTNSPKVDLFKALLEVKGMIEILYEKLAAKI